MAQLLRDPVSEAPRDLQSALLLGLATGLRTFSAPAAMALRDRPLDAARAAVLLAAAGELVADKLPDMPSRLARRGLTGRLLSSTISGARVAGLSGAATAAGAALASAVAGHAARVRFAGPLAAVGEDCVAIALASLGAARSAGD
jgi:uncharacterized membrane protein